MEPNEPQVHSHFENYIHGRVPNVQNFGWKSKQAPNWAPKIPLEKGFEV